jgi:ABC-type Zn uptake system ZnuABC Zn-binding protein ZnuA
MSKSLLPLLLAVVIAAGGVACGDEGASGVDGDERLQVLASTAIVEALAREVGGDAADVAVLVPSGTDPHEFNLSPSDRARLEDADVVVRIGAGFDDAYVEGGDSVLTLTEGIDLRDPDEGSEHGDGDPHVWHDPVNCIEMAEAIAERFAAEDPGSADLFRANAAALRGRLEAVDLEIRRLVEGVPPDQRKVVTNHDAFGYFLDRYGLEFVGAVIPSTSTAAEPSAKDIADLIEAIEREGVKAIFAEATVDPAVARQVARDTGATIVEGLYSESLGPSGSGADTIDGMLLANARKIADALN